MQRACKTVRSNLGFLSQEAVALTPLFPKAHSRNGSLWMTSSMQGANLKVLAGLCFRDELPSTLDQGISQS